jgi:hypothetical protein
MAHAFATLNDQELLDEIFATLTRSVNPLANPYGSDGFYAAAIGPLPKGLRAMAATHHLDISLTLDGIGWHFLNFGEPNLVRMTESGLRELGLADIADWFAEAFTIVGPLRPEIEAVGDYYECIVQHGHTARIDELTCKTVGKEPSLNGSAIYYAWVVYARQHPEDVFVS